MWLYEILIFMLYFQRCLVKIIFFEDETLSYFFELNINYKYMLYRLIYCIEIN